MPRYKFCKLGDFESTTSFESKSTENLCLIETEIAKGLCLIDSPQRFSQTSRTEERFDVSEDWDAFERPLW